MRKVKKRLVTKQPDISKYAAIGGIATAIGVGIWYWLKKPAPIPGGACTVEGQTKCSGLDLYVCQGGVWVLQEVNAPQCSAPEEPPIGEWVRVDTITVTIPESGIPVSGEWANVDSVSVIVPESLIPVPGEWVNVDSIKVIIPESVVPIPAEWVNVDSIKVTIPEAIVIPTTTVTIELKNHESVFGGLGYWWFCRLWDPVAGKWVSDDKWHKVTEKITFRNVPEGERSMLSVFLKRQYTNIQSEEFRSNWFTPYSYGTNCWYRYNLVTNNVAIICV